MVETATVGVPEVEVAEAKRFIGSTPPGDVSFLTDSLGLVVSSRSYDPWGEARTQVGEQADLGYQGDPTDEETGLVDMGARYYLPSLGRFTTVDIYEGESVDPLTRNPYIYALDDPMSMVDPTGHAANDVGSGGPCDDCDQTSLTRYGILTDQVDGSYAGGPYDGADESTFSRYAFKPMPGGRLQIDFFIDDFTSFVLRGDNRDFSLDKDKSSRVRIELDLSRGHAKATVFKSCPVFSIGGGLCNPGRPLDGGDNTLEITQRPRGELWVKYDLISSLFSFTKVGSVDGEILLIPHDGTFDVWVGRNPYPALEIVQESFGERRFIVQEHAKPWFTAFDGRGKTYALYENDEW